MTEIGAGDAYRDALGNQQFSLREENPSEMTRAEIKQVATKYVDDQIAIMEKHGAMRILSPGEYYSLIQQVVEVTLQLRAKYGHKDDD